MSLASPFWEISIAQEQGTRADQQDQCGAWFSPDGRTVFAVLADGAGGHRGGARAAHLAVQAAKALWEGEQPGEPSADFLESASVAAHRAIKSEFPGSSPARATWVALIATPQKACWVHSGDSRLYHLAAGKLMAKTRDHSVAQVLVDQGKITQLEIPTHPDRSTLLSSLGGSEYLPVENGSATLNGQNQFLLCTDGFWNQITDKELVAFAEESASDWMTRTQGLVAKAVKRAGEYADNTSLLVCRSIKAL